MTNGEIRLRIAKAINGPFKSEPENLDYTINELRDIKWDNTSSMRQNQLLMQASSVLNETKDMMQNPTEDMVDGARHIFSWLNGTPHPTYRNLRTHCRLLGKPLPTGCEDINHHPPKAQQAAWVWEAMFNQSPLVPKDE